MYPSKHVNPIFKYSYSSPFLPQPLLPSHTSSIKKHSPPPPSPLNSASAGGDPIQRLKYYIKQHISRTGARCASFRYTLKELQNREYEYLDIKIITGDEWKEIEITPKIIKTLKDKIKDFQQYIYYTGDNQGAGVQINNKTENINNVSDINNAASSSIDINDDEFA